MQAGQRQLSCSQASSRVPLLHVLQDGDIRASTEGTVRRHDKLPSTRCQRSKQKDKGQPREGRSARVRWGSLVDSDETERRKGSEEWIHQVVRRRVPEE